MISSKGTNARAPAFCPTCKLNLEGFPVGFRFAPSDQQLIHHLESMVLAKEAGGSKQHALIHHFISTIEGDNDICYTHPENLPGVTRDGHSKHFFHRTTKAYPNSTRKRRKISSENDQRSSEDGGDAYWHRTGNSRPVFVGGKQKGYKKILVLHNIKQGKREKTNWVMHQYHLGMSEVEKDGDMVMSKVFYRFPTAEVTEQSDEKLEVIGQNDEMAEVTSKATPNILHDSGAAAAAATDTMVQLQHQLQKQAQGHGQCKVAPAKKFQEAGLGDPVSSEQGQVHGYNHHIPSQHHVQSVDTEPDTTLSLAISAGWST